MARFLATVDDRNVVVNVLATLPPHPAHPCLTDDTPALETYSLRGIGRNSGAYTALLKSRGWTVIGPWGFADYYRSAQRPCAEVIRA